MLVNFAGPRVQGASGASGVAPFRCPQERTESGGNSVGSGETCLFGKGKGTWWMFLVGNWEYYLFSLEESTREVS